MTKVVKPRTDIHVQLSGEDGNIFNLMGIASRALKRGGYSTLASDMVKEITQEARDYHSALRIIGEYVHIS